MTGYNYPDNLYADHLAKQSPTGAYRSTDAVNHPAHYRRAGIETIDYIRASLGNGFGPYCIGNVLKYVSRYREKGGVEDLSKARVYLDWAIKALQKQTLSELAADSQMLGLYDDPVCTSGERVQKTAKSVHDDLPPVLTEALREFGIGDVPPKPEAGGSGHMYVAGIGRVAYKIGANGVPRHPMCAEADRLSKPGDML